MAGRFGSPKLAILRAAFQYGGVGFPPAPRPLRLAQATQQQDQPNPSKS